MTNKTYPEKIVVDVDARLHLEHIDKPMSEHYIQHVVGKVISYPNKGEYEVELYPDGNTRFSQITSGPCVVLIILFILDWPKKAEAQEQEKRQKRGLPDPQNFLDLSNGEYSAIVRLNFEDGYAFKKCSMRKLSEDHYEATIDTTHRYPSSKSKGLTKILPHDIMLTDAGPGKIIGRSQVGWIREDLSILRGDAEIIVSLDNNFIRLPMPEIYSYTYEHSPFDEFPFKLKATGLMRAVDTPPELIEFDESNRTFMG